MSFDDIEKVRIENPVNKYPAKSWVAHTVNGKRRPEIDLSWKKSFTDSTLTMGGFDNKSTSPFWGCCASGFSSRSATAEGVAYS